MPGLVGDFFFPDTCQIHKHQRTKLSIRSLKRHTMAAYSGANLDRLFSVRSEKLKTLDIDVTHRTVRRIGPRPSTAAGTHGVTLHELIENMYAGMIAEKRKNGRQSQLLLDCFELAAFANDYLDSEDALAGVIIHWCLGLCDKYAMLQVRRRDVLQSWNSVSCLQALVSVTVEAVGTIER